MLVLGLADNHDSGAALVADGRLLAAVGQERLDRVKNSGAFPWDAIDAVLGQAGVRPSEVDLLALGTAFTPATLLRLLPRAHHRARETGSFSYLLNLYIAYQVGLRHLGAHRLERAASHALLARRLARRGFRAPLVLLDHHEAHAHAAYRSQPRDPVLVLTLDAMGDGLSATAWLGRGGRLEPLWRQSGLAAIDTFYSRVTEYLGFRPNRHEGKVTGLAAYAEPPPELVRHLRGFLRYEGGRFNRLPVHRRQHPRDQRWRFLADYSRAEIAAAAQAVLEDAVLAFVRDQLSRAGVAELAVAGGVFANVKLNQRIAGLPELRSLWVYPNMGDGGLAAGAALGAAGAPPRRTPHLYLGPGYSESDCGRALARRGLPRRRPEDLEGEVAELLARGKVVARFDGRVEWGPRALGNRSILYRADDPTVNDWLNQRLRRTEFMPFAPISLADEAPGLYLGLDKAADAARFMTVSFDCTETMRRRNPGVVHVDGTARPQVLHPEDNPAVHRLLERYRALTGSGTLVNTSFNLHEEPIVCTPEDALRAWEQARLDALVLGPYLLLREENR